MELPNAGTRWAGAVLWMALAAGTAWPQVPPDIEAGLLKIGQVVDPACTIREASPQTRVMWRTLQRAGAAFRLR